MTVRLTRRGIRRSKDLNPNPNNWNCSMPDDTTDVARRYDRRERK